MTYDPKKYMDKVHHVGFVVEDIDRSIDFYVNELGFTLFDRWSETPDEVQSGMGVDKAALELAQVAGYGCLIEFLVHVGAPGPKEYPKPDCIGVGHPAFLVKDLRGFVKELRGRGVQMGGEIVELPTSRWVHVIDPDGVRIEIMEFFDEESWPASKNKEK